MAKLKNSVGKERKLKQETQETMAKNVGLSRVGLSNIETGGAEPNLNTALRIAKWLGKPVEKIFKLEDTE